MNSKFSTTMMQNSLEIVDYPSVQFGVPSSAPAPSSTHHATQPLPPHSQPTCVRRAVLSLFEIIRKEAPSAFLFETADPTTRVVQRTLIGLGPSKTLRRMFDLDRQLEIVEEITSGLTQELSIGFFSALENLQAEIKNSETLKNEQAESGRVPYLHGGIFGSIGYESVQEIERKVTAPSSVGPFADVNLVSAEVVVAHDLIVFDHVEKKVFLIGAHTGIIYRSALAKMSATSPPTPLRVVAPASPSLHRNEVDGERIIASMGKEKFCAHVKTLKEHIRAGDVFQAVLAERFTINTQANAFSIFKRLTEINAAPFHFFFPFSDGEFAGTSPESLVQVKEQVAITHPIAGTKPRGESDVEDLRQEHSLLRSRKEAAEHLMLVDLARNDLGRVAKAGSVRVTKYRELHKFATVMHLVSEVTAQLPSALNAMEAFSACFPAGTLTGAPKVRAMLILSGLEASRRGFYGGAVIALDPVSNHLESCIAIRCFKKTGDQVALQAGAGIVADSRAELEYAEVSHKLRALRQAISAAENSPRVESLVDFVTPYIAGGAS